VLQRGKARASRQAAMRAASMAARACCPSSCSSRRWRRPCSARAWPCWGVPSRPAHRALRCRGLRAFPCLPQARMGRARSVARLTFRLRFGLALGSALGRRPSAPSAVAGRQRQGRPRPRGLDA
jgi:hypothetical protein